MSVDVSRSFRSPLDDRDAHLVALTGLRLFAALWVVLFHYRVTIADWIPGGELVEPILNVGFLGVDLFFALSGFILSHRYLDRLGPSFRRREIADFLRLRLARIYPVHLFMILVVGATTLLLAQVGEQKGLPATLGARSLAENLMLVHAWLNQALSWNLPAWSISLEWLAYLTFPVLALVFFRLQTRPAGVIAALMIAALVYLPLLLQSADVITLGDPGDGALGVNLMRILAGFVSGCALFVVMRELASRRRLSALIANAVTRAALVSGILVLSYWFGATGEQDSGAIQFGAAGVYSSSAWIVTPLLALLVAVISLAALPGSGSRVLETRAVVLGGVISYSLYMTHTLVIAVLGGEEGGLVAYRLGLNDANALVQCVFALLVLSACVLTAWLTWRIVEEPARRALRKASVQRAGALPVEERTP